MAELFLQLFETAVETFFLSFDRLALESKDLPRVYFAGEVLDIDGITGGFNFQAAWTTAFTVAQAIAINQSTQCTQTPSQE